MKLTLYKGQYSGDVVQRSQVDDILITNTVYALNNNIPNWHYHENLHFCFVFQGGKSETKKSTKYTQQYGSIFFYHSEEMHRWVSPLPISKSINIEVGRGFLEKYNVTERQIKNALEKNIDSRAIILKILKEMNLNDLQSQLTINALLLELISYKSSNYSTTVPNWVKTLNELLHDDAEMNHSLSELASILDIHPVTISKNFRKYFGCTLGEYRRRLKISKSIDLIKNSENSLSEIAFECGFSDQSHFIRNFKQRTGFLPKDFRNF